MIRTLSAGFLALSLLSAAGPHQAFAQAHSKNARESTSDKHQAGQAQRDNAKKRADVLDAKGSNSKASKASVAQQQKQAKKNASHADRDAKNQDRRDQKAAKKAEKAERQAQMDAD